MSDNKDDLIRQLAASYGIPVTTDKQKTYYDAATGTLYCEGLTVSKKTIEKAYDHFSSQRDHLKGLADRNSDLSEQYLFNVVACNAIRLLHETVKKD